jgi:hypothetical protein
MINDQMTIFVYIKVIFIFEYNVLLLCITKVIFVTMNKKNYSNKITKILKNYHNIWIKNEDREPMVFVRI